MNTVTLTPQAQEYIQGKLSAAPEAQGLRLGVKKSGCSGFAYDISLAPVVNTNDVVIEDPSNVRLIVREDHLPYFKNMVIDCIHEDFGSYLKFENPNVKGECGCGESMSFEEFEE